MLSLEIHPAAELFPLLENGSFESFKADIAMNGQLEAIWLCEGKILDGRNRYRACSELGIEPKYREYSGDSPVAFAWSLNGERRHLTNGQRAAIGVEMLPALKEEARKRVEATQFGNRGSNINVGAEKGEAAEHAAKIVGVCVTNVRKAKAVKERDPEAFEKIKAGKLSVGTAHRAAREKPVTTPSRNQPNDKRVAVIREMTTEGHSAEQIAANQGIDVERVRLLANRAGIKLADAAYNRSHKFSARRVVEATVSSLEGIALGLQTIDGGSLEIEKPEAAELAQSIASSLRIINRLHKQLKDYSTHE